MQWVKGASDCFNECECTAPIEQGSFLQTVDIPCVKKLTTDTLIPLTTTQRPDTCGKCEYYYDPQKKGWQFSLSDCDLTCECVEPNWTPEDGMPTVVQTACDIKTTTPSPIGVFDLTNKDLVQEIYYS
jgi:hypothetical protein